MGPSKANEMLVSDKNTWKERETDMKKKVTWKDVYSPGNGGLRFGQSIDWE